MTTTVNKTRPLQLNITIVLTYPSTSLSSLASFMPVTNYCLCELDIDPLFCKQSILEPKYPSNHGSWEATLHPAKLNVLAELTKYYR